MQIDGPDWNELFDVDATSLPALEDQSFSSGKINNYACCFTF